MGRKRVETNISYDTQRRTYYVYMDYGVDEQGQRMRQYKTYSSLSRARRALREFVIQKNTGRVVAPSAITLGQWLEYWMEEIVLPNRAVTTVYGYRNIVHNHMIPALGRIKLQKLSPKDLQQYYNMLARDKGLSSNTVRRHHDLLSNCLHSAVRQDLLLRSPTERVEPPRAVQFEAHFYSPQELKQLYALVEGHWLEVIVRLAGSLGLRREEICGLRWDSVDFERRKVHIKHARTSAGADTVLKETKTRTSNRILHLTDDLYCLLQRELDRQNRNRLLAREEWPGTGLVVVDEQGRPYPPNRISLAFGQFIQSHDLPKITLHGLRHTFATVASAQGAPLFDIGRALGHSTPSTTGRIYTHLQDQNHAETLGRVAAALK